MKNIFNQLRNTIIVILVVGSQCVLAGDLGVFTDNSGGNGSNRIRVYADEDKALVTAYGVTSLYKRSESFQLYTDARGDYVEVLALDAVLWVTGAKTNTPITRSLLKMKTCN